MNIQILTFSLADSYGANLQCYALSKVLIDMGHNVELIPIKLPLTTMRSKIGYYIYNSMFYSFRKRYFPPFVKKMSNRNVDVYIVGSDQVWNLSITKELYRSFFFSNIDINKKRISYAASIGNITWNFPEKKEEISDYLNKFSAISVREESAKQICKHIFNIKAQRVLDPSLLLTEYNELLNEIQYPKTENLICFKLHYTAEFPKLAKFISAKTNTQIIHLASRYFCDGKHYRFVSMKQWAKMIATAKILLTDSFHGVAFAIINKIQFIAIPSYTERKGRITELLEILELKDRFFEDTKQIYTEISWLDPIDYEKVYKKLSILREESLNFLRNSIV